MSFFYGEFLVEIIKTLDLEMSFINGTIKTDVLKGINININKGDFAGIVGPSGSGKTTLLYCLSSLEKITSGSVLFMGKDITKYSSKELSELRKHDLGFVFQFYNLIPNLTVYENILLPQVIAGEDGSYIDEILEMVGMKEYKTYYPNQLSGGMQQRVAIARALVNKPKIIFADEPTGNLDQKKGLEIMKILKRLNAENEITIVLVTHNEDYLDFCNKKIRLVDGHIVK
ncbi:MAG: ABC transporter ATP-binding protein [Tenericutes bacterium]|nr:ABC transporter ATP-binding protein [Mycoplasmatota bacterium]